MKVTKKFLDTERASSFALGAISVVLLMGGVELMSPFWRAEVPKLTLIQHLEIAETHDKGDAEIAAALAKYMPAVSLCEEVRVPVYINCEENWADQSDCDCEIDYNNGFENGFDNGKQEGWKSCETITAEKVNPKDAILKHRNFRDSKGNLPKYTQE